MPEGRTGENQRVEEKGSLVTDCGFEIKILYNVCSSSFSFVSEPQLDFY